MAMNSEEIKPESIIPFSGNFIISILTISHLVFRSISSTTLSISINPIQAQTTINKDEEQSIARR